MKSIVKLVIAFCIILSVVAVPVSDSKGRSLKRSNGHYSSSNSYSSTSKRGGGRKSKRGKSKKSKGKSGKKDKDPECIGSPDQVGGAIAALQDPKRSCKHNHLVAHIGIQRDAGINSRFPGTPLTPRPTDGAAYKLNGGLGPYPDINELRQIIAPYAKI